MKIPRFYYVIGLASIVLGASLVVPHFSKRSESLDTITESVDPQIRNINLEFQVRELREEHEELKTKYDEVFKDRYDKSTEVKSLKRKIDIRYAMFNQIMNGKDITTINLETENSELSFENERFKKFLRKNGYDLNRITKGLDTGPTEFEMFKARYDKDHASWERDRLFVEGINAKLDAEKRKLKDQLKAYKDYHGRMQIWLKDKGYDVEDLGNQKD